MCVPGVRVYVYRHRFSHTISDAKYFTLISYHSRYLHTGWHRLPFITYRTHWPDRFCLVLIINSYSKKDGNRFYLGNSSDEVIGNKSTSQSIRVTATRQVQGVRTGEHDIPLKQFLLFVVVDNKFDLQAMPQLSRDSRSINKQCNCETTRTRVEHKD